MIRKIDVRVGLTADMTLTEALELQTRLEGGPATDNTEALRVALAIQLDAARQAITFTAKAS